VSDYPQYGNTPIVTPLPGIIDDLFAPIEVKDNGRVVRRVSFKAEPVDKGAPWFKVHVAQMTNDERFFMLTNAERGLLIMLWCMAATRLIIPSNPKVLAKMTRTPNEEFERLWPQLEQFFIKTDQGMYSPEMTKTIREVYVGLEQSKFGGEKSASRRKGGFY